MLKTTDLYTLDEWFLWHVNLISIKLLNIYTHIYLTFYIFTWCPATLLNSTISSGSIYEDSLGFLNTLSENKDSCILPIYSACLLFLFPALLHWLGPPIQCWIELVRAKITSEVYHSFIKGKEWKRSFWEGKGMSTDETRGCELQRGLPACLAKE